MGPAVWLALDFRWLVRHFIAKGTHTSGFQPVPGVPFVPFPLNWLERFGIALFQHTPCVPSRMAQPSAELCDGGVMPVFGGTLLVVVAVFLPPVLTSAAR